MRVALCLSGRCERIEDTHSSIRKMLIEPNGADVFMHIEDDNTAPSAEKYFPEAEIIKVPYEPIPEDIVYYENIGTRGRPDYKQRHLQQMYHIKECADMVPNEYDCVIRSRIDLIFSEEVVVSKYPMNAIYVGGIDHEQRCVCDRFAFGSYSLMRHYALRVEFAKAQTEPLVHDGRKHAFVENELYEVLDGLPVKQIEIIFKRAM